MIQALGKYVEVPKLPDSQPLHALFFLALYHQHYSSFADNQRKVLLSPLRQAVQIFLQNQEYLSVGEDLLLQLIETCERSVSDQLQKAFNRRRIQTSLQVRIQLCFIKRREKVSVMRERVLQLLKELKETSPRLMTEVLANTPVAFNFQANNLKENTSMQQMTNLYLALTKEKLNCLELVPAMWQHSQKIGLQAVDLMSALLQLGQGAVHHFLQLFLQQDLSPQKVSAAGISKMLKKKGEVSRLKDQMQYSRRGAKKKVMNIRISQQISSENQIFKESNFTDIKKNVIKNLVFLESLNSKFNQVHQFVGRIVKTSPERLVRLDQRVSDLLKRIVLKHGQQIKTFHKYYFLQEMGCRHAPQFFPLNLPQDLEIQGLDSQYKTLALRREFEIQVVKSEPLRKIRKLEEPKPKAEQKKQQKKEEPLYEEPVETWNIILPVL